jgi:hypothetical protein
MAVRVTPITDSDVRPVAEFLHAHMPRRASAEAWERSLRVPWRVDAPNHGFMLVADGAEGAAGGGAAPGGARIVGVYVAFYSERSIDGRPERFCNLGAWCVLPEQRMQALRLLRALLGQPGYHFTDLSPSGSVVAINTRLAFERLDTTTALVPNLPWPFWSGRAVSADPEVIERTLGGDALKLYRDHARAPAARHLVLRSGADWCYVVFRRDRRKGLPLFASILYVSHPEVFRRMVRPLSRHLLLRHGIPASLVELRIAGHRPRPSLLLRTPRPKMFKSARLRAEQIDDLYSELVCTPT